MTQRVGEKRGRTQWRAPSVTAGFRRWNDGGYPNLATGPRDNNQAEPKPGEKDQQLRRPGTKLDDRDVAVAFMIGIARMVVSQLMGVVERRAVVKVDRCAMNMGALGYADVAVGIDMHVQTAHLRGREPQAGQYQKWRAWAAHDASIPSETTAIDRLPADQRRASSV